MGYYQSGDWYAAGDPGLFSWLGGAARAVTSALGTAGSFVGRTIARIAPIAAPIVGGIFGGPVGAAIGGGVGSLISGGGDLMGALSPTAPDPTPMSPVYSDMYTTTAPPSRTVQGYRAQPMTVSYPAPFEEVGMGEEFDEEEY